MERRTTVRDIAKRAGVHFTTVSRALSKHPSIPVTTCERIRKIAEELHYVPDPMLSALTAYRTRLAAPTFHGNLGWMTNSSTREGWNTCPTFDLYLQGAQARAAELGYKLEEFWLREPGLTNRRSMEILRARNIQGVILSPQPRPKMRLRLGWDRLSAVTFGFTLAWPRLHRVANNHFHSMQMLVRHLRAMGYRRLGLVLDVTKDDRVERAWSGGFLSLQHDWARAEKVPPLILPKVAAPGFLKWFRASRPDVVICQELDLLGVLTDSGYRVPEDVGFATPTITSGPHRRAIAGLDENAMEAGKVAVDLVVGMIHRGESGIPKLPQDVTIESQWSPGDTVMRQKTAPPARFFPMVS
jgi:LacI family transcriptional regulator